MVMSGYPSPPVVQYRDVSEGLLSNGLGLQNNGPEMSDHEETHQRSNGSKAFHTESSEDDHRIKFEEWGFNIDRLFEVAYRFYKRNESKAFHPTFDERNQMNALVMQARFGNHDSGKAPDVGVLDLVGKRRQYEWSLLKGMSRTEAMTKFICTLDEICPIFKAHAEAVKISSSASKIAHLSNGPTMTGQKQDSRLSDTNAQLQSIYTSLCKQTHDQFKKYAEKQHPSDPVQQKYLITSLQEQYYQQYVSQMHPELRDSLPGGSQTSNSIGNIPSPMPSPSTSELLTTRIDVSSGNEAANLHAAQALIIPERTPEPPALTSCDDATERQSGDRESAPIGLGFDTEHNSAPEKENNVEADISCEELNTEICQAAQGDQEGAVEEVQNIETSEEQSTKKSLSETPQTQKKSREPEGLNKIFNMPPIGMFESFPEPKLIQKATHRSTPIDLINPNLPSLPPLPPEIQQADRAQESSEQPRAIEEGGPQQNKSNQQIESSPVTQDATFIPMYTSDQGEVGSHEHPTYEQDESHLVYHGVDLNGGLVAQKSHQDQDSPSPVAHEPSEASEQPEPNQPPEPWGTPDGFPLQEAVVYGPLEPATIWTKGAVSEFKESLGGDKQGGIYEVKESALVIIQVPTYPDGKYIYWEFATDDYDLGFGVDFIYEQNLAQPLALNIYEENEDDDLDDLVDSHSYRDSEMTQDVESNSGQISGERDRVVSAMRRRIANTVSIIPTYRRDSHEEVFVGRHKYPGQGYYLLRFDNTYSVLRSKTLYFRICYFI